MVFEPFINQYQQELAISSPRGVSAVLDQEADGFVKAEAVCCLFLQRRRDARRNYAHVRSARMNVDGHKKMGKPAHPMLPPAPHQTPLIIVQMNSILTRFM